MTTYAKTPKWVKEKLQKDRERLQELSRQVKELVQEKGYRNVNAAIVAEIYSNEQNGTTFKTAPEWKEAGFLIVKGSKGYPVWGKKVHITGTDGKERPYHRIAYIFSEKQVFTVNAD